MNSQKIDWIAIDWGTTHLRAWIMGPDERLIATVQSEDGMGGLAPEEFEPALLALVRQHLSADRRTPVICAGMVGARQGWSEAAYLDVPCAPTAVDRCVQAPTTDQRLDVRILPGVKQDDPADVMRGEETQINGFLRHLPDFQGVICLPGTHTKWAQVKAGMITSFATFMTGEQFSLLSTVSVLRHSISDEGWDEDALFSAVCEAVSHPEMTAGRLFRLRADSILNDLSGDRARARLSGLLIGQELAAARPFWEDQDVVLIGAAELSRIYAVALELLGCVPRLADADRMTLSGLSAAHEMLLEETR